VKLTKDMLAGALFFVVGACFFFVGRDYPLGTARAMGPGYFPAIVSVGVMICGLVTAVRSYIHDEAIELKLDFSLRPFAFVFMAVIAFALLIDSAGLIPALAVTVILSRLAAPKAGILEVAGLVFIISAVIIGVFVLALGVPLTLGI
jgi:hypothetical protein